MDIIKVSGTKSNKLISYINRVSSFLNLNIHECHYGLEIIRTCDHQAGGYCYGNNEEIEIEIARVDNAGPIPLKNLMINIAHELVHAQQIASGRLVNRGFLLKDNILTYGWIWEGQEYSQISYDKQPWEIEARNLEENIYNLCK
jgi:hypothetical protein